MKEIPEIWPDLKANGLPEGQTDVVMITDAIARIPDDMADGYRRWAQAEQAKTYGIVVGPHKPGALAKIADRHWCIPELSVDSDAVGAVLSI